MELKEYYQILKRNYSVIIYTILIFVVLVYAWSQKVSVEYRTEMLLNITRSNSQDSQDYRYDQFYRIQADEKFAQTIEEWLRFPGICAEIFSSAGIDHSSSSMGQLAKSFSAAQVSPQSVLVKYNTNSENDSKRIYDALGTVISAKTTELNNTSKDPNWFKIIPSGYIVKKNTQDLRLNLGFAAIAGVIFGCFFALFKHYLAEDKECKN